MQDSADNQKPVKALKRKAGRPSNDQAAGIAVQKVQWLEAYPRLGWRGACDAVGGISESTPQNWRKIDPVFAAQFNAVQPLIADTLERLMEQVITGQQPMDRVQMTLLIFRLKALRPMYRDRVALEHTGADGGAIKVENAGDSQRGMQMLTSWGNRLKSN